MATVVTTFDALGILCKVGVYTAKEIRQDLELTQADVDAIEVQGPGAPLILQREDGDDTWTVKSVG